MHTNIEAGKEQGLGLPLRGQTDLAQNLHGPGPGLGKGLEEEEKGPRLRNN